MIKLPWNRNFLPQNSHECTASVDCACFGGVDAERGVVRIVRASSFVPSIACFSGGVKLCGRELFVNGVGGNCDGDGLANDGDCCLRGLGELAVAKLFPGLVVPAN